MTTTDLTGLRLALRRTSERYRLHVGRQRDQIIDDRDAAVTAAYRAGMEQADIAADTGLSAQRISQIVAARDGAQAPARARADDRRAQAIALADKAGGRGVTVREVQRATGCTRTAAEWALSALVENGWLTAVPRGTATRDRFTLYLPAGTALDLAGRS